MESERRAIDSFDENWYAAGPSEGYAVHVNSALALPAVGFATEALQLGLPQALAAAGDRLPSPRVLSRWPLFRLLLLPVHAAESYPKKSVNADKKDKASREPRRGRLRVLLVVSSHAEGDYAHY